MPRPSSSEPVAALAEAPHPTASARRAAADAPSVWADYWSLTKPEITFLVVVSALAGFLLGTPGALDGWTLLWTLLGVALTGGGAGVLNHVIERDLDAEMKRTSARPLAAGRVDVRRAKLFGYGLVAAGVGVICPLVNPLTAILALVTAALYVYVYTPMKRRSKWNTLVGTLPGALPALGGYAAATGTLGAAGWAWFAVLAVWQMPHFLSLAWMYRKDYERGGYAMLPVVEPMGVSTAMQTLGFTALLVPVGVLPAFLVPTMGWLYGLGALALGLWFVRPAWTFYRSRTNADAKRVLLASIVYIPALTLLVVLDWLV